MDRFAILTMSRGDRYRIKEWLEYHSRIGFTDFYIILDNPNDDTADILRAVKTSANINVVVKGANGPYYDDVNMPLVWEKRKEWKKENQVEIDKSGLPINDEISWRQYQYFSEIIPEIQRLGVVSWLSLIDVDEYIALSDYNYVSELIEDVGAERVRLLNFNYDTDGYTPESGQSIVEYSKCRWSHQDIINYGKGWDKRYKSIVKLERALPLASVHAISKGPFKVVHHEKAKLNHYKCPAMKIIPYSVYEPLRISE
ncbi:glycosyltransferase family 2 protein [Microbulbifer halophilus]|uniref:Glycosyltransferase family 2 protein n=1 Tax=Microbulbifer halophilus TaxID=453963 RepID=A0ABW5EES8_9GAMM|nr:glycosyltransferase family 2 protein [Microbulbifer halophilus]MCW8128362.1 glycosyltransferase family 2 protein [Microbulbifer halophilus]